MASKPICTEQRCRQSCTLLRRMFGLRANPTVESLFAIFKVLQKSERIRLAVTHKRAA